MTTHLQGGVVIKCDLGSSYQRRYLILKGSLLWVSKQPLLLDHRAHAQHLTGREEYLTIQLSPDSSVSCPETQNQALPCELNVTGTLERNGAMSSFSLSFMHACERESWLHAIETSKNYILCQKSNGRYDFLLSLACRMQQAVPAVDRFYHLVRYRKCILGSEAVVWLIHDQKCSQEESLSLGNEMIDLGFFHHVSHEHFMCQAYLFYRFNFIALSESDNFRSNSQNTNGCNDVLKHTQQAQEDQAEQDEEERVEQESTLPLLHAVEDLEVENKNLRDRVHDFEVAFRTQSFCAAAQLKDSISTLEQLEGTVIAVFRGLSVVAVIVVLCPSLFLISSVSYFIFTLHLIVLEYFTQKVSENVHTWGMLCAESLNICTTCFAHSPSQKLKTRIKERQKEVDQIEDTLNYSAIDEATGIRVSATDEQENHHKNEKEKEADDDILSKRKLEVLGSTQSKDNLLIPPCTEWPNFPLLVRRSPDMYVRHPCNAAAQNLVSCPEYNEFDMETERSTDCEYDEEKNFLIEESLTSSKNLLTLITPLHIHKTPPQLSIFPIDNHLFKGKVFVVFAGLDDSPAEFFAHKNRLFEVVVQGRFKQVTPFSSVYNGQLFKKPFHTLPPKWIMRILLGLLSKIQPGLQVDMHGSSPYMVSSLIAASKNVVVSAPGTEPDICIVGKSSTDTVREDMTLLVSSENDDYTNRIFDSRSPSKRANFFSDMKNLEKFYYSKDHVYTFDFYQHVFNIAQMKLDLGFTSLDVSKIIGFAPVQIMAVLWDPHIEPDLDHVEYFYNIELWNKKCFPSNYFDRK